MNLYKTTKQLFRSLLFRLDAEIASGYSKSNLAKSLSEPTVYEGSVIYAR